MKKTNFNFTYFFALLMLSLVTAGQDNPDFTLASNGVTCLCPNANFGDVGTLIINGESKTFTKRSRTQLDTFIDNDIDDPQIALTCTSGITDMSSLFSSLYVGNVDSFNQNLEHWDVSNVTTMSSLFSGASSFNQPLNDWDVSQVTSMVRVFDSATDFNQPLDNWDTSNVTTMTSMFDGASSFNQSLNDWDVSQVSNMRGFFRDATDFNQPLNNWDTSNVNLLGRMFLNAHNFDQALNDWDTSNVTSMNNMFTGASSFNQPLDNWDISNVTSLYGMFINAVSFNQDLSDWVFNQDVILSNLLISCDLSPANYDLLLQSFDNQNLVDKTLNSLSLGYCDVTTRDNLINNKNWTITGDVLGQCGATYNPSTLPFVTTWTVQQDDLDIEIFTINAYDYDFSVDWGDGQTDQNVNADITHTYSNPGTYSVSIIGVFPYFKTCKAATSNSGSECTNTTKLSSVELWGNQEWRFMVGSFNRAENFILNDTQAPDLSYITSLKQTFAHTDNFNGDINNWDVSNVTNMTVLFFDATNFDNGLNSWDVSNVTTMSDMFQDATSFNKPLNNWDVSNVRDMKRMFQGATSFNQTLNNWDVSNTKDMGNMFFGASSFNQFIGDWDVSNVVHMYGMFDSATSFNQGLNNWDVSNVTEMFYMFTNASSFNQYIGDWDVSNVTEMFLMFTGATVFNQDISSWCVEQIPSEPDDFAAFSALQPSFFPDWGATCPLSIAENDLDNFKVYPNPVQDQLNLFWSNVSFPDDINLHIYNLSGKRVFEKSFDQKPSVLNFGFLSSGVYILKITSGKKSSVRRIVKK